MTDLYNWGPRSRGLMLTIHPDLVITLEAALSISPFDLTIICGRRDKEAQDKAFLEGTSKRRWADSQHNCLEPDGLSLAVDVAPWINNKIPWEDEGTFYAMAGCVVSSANLLGIQVGYGGDWNHNGLTEDQTWNDLGHFFLIE